jgi:hypothetical protein
MQKIRRFMSSIFPIFNYPNTNEPKNKENIVYHYHRIEIVNPKLSNSSEPGFPPTRIATIKSIGADVLICLGSLMGLLAGMALALQSAGLAAPALTILANLLMPAVAAVLAGSHLSKPDLKPNTNVRLSTGIPGLTFTS